MSDGQPPLNSDADERRVERLASACFLAAGAAGVLLLGLYVAGGQTQLEGLLLTICLGGLGVGVILWAKDLTPTVEQTEPRHSLESSPEPPVASAGLSRRKLLSRSLLAGVGGLAAALAIPALSLGPAPGSSLKHTSWAKGTRLVTGDGKPLNAGDLAVDSIATVFPEGHLDDASAPTLLIRVPDGSLRVAADRLAGAPAGYIAYSKVCTHAGCPVGLYRAAQRQLICPCHQSTFDVLDGAVPIFGPAARPLPQLPIAIAADGTITALGDFSEPVGPSFWDVHS